MIEDADCTSVKSCSSSVGRNRLNMFAEGMVGDKLIVNVREDNGYTTKQVSLALLYR